MELEDIPVADLARENFAIIHLFIQYNIDFFCKGAKSLKEAIAESGTEEATFLKQLKEVRAQKPQLYAMDVEKWPLDLLADYIQKTHHRYTEETLLRIKALINEMPSNGSDEEGIIEVFKHTLEPLSGELAMHMKKEELMLFPAVKRIVTKQVSPNVSIPVSIDAHVKTMTDEHDMQYKALKKIREVFNDYAYREGKEHYNNIVELMRGLDRDLALHIHLENNILFPKAIELTRNTP